MKFLESTEALFAPTLSFLSSQSSSLAHSNMSTSVQLPPNEHRAIELFEEGMAEEASGRMSEAAQLYRRAYKLNDHVDLLYRKHKLPEAMQSVIEKRGKNAVKVDEEIVKRINVDDLLDSFSNLEIATKSNLELELSLPEVDDSEETNDVEKDVPNVESSTKKLLVMVEEPSPLLQLPQDVWIRILEVLILVQPESWFNYSITCKKNAFTGFRTAILWEKLCELTFPLQIYQENKEMQLVVVKPDDLPFPRTQSLIVLQYDSSWKKMLSSRPFIKFCGLYISVVNYYSQGGRAELLDSWLSPVRLITYYRYIRFYPDGSCIKLLTHMQPQVVVPQFHRGISELRDDSQAAKVYRGQWTINGEGQVHLLITEGSVPAYNFHYYFYIKSLGPIFRHNKLVWDKYYAIKKVTDWADDDRHEFALKNEKLFTFLRVRSYQQQHLQEVYGDQKK